MSDDVIAFVSLARLASGSGSQSDVLAMASQLMAGVIPEATIAWFLVDESSGRLAVADAAGPGAREVRGVSLAMAEGLSGWVAAQRQVIVNSEAALDLGERAARANLQCGLSAPLIAGEALVGTITLYASKSAAFTEDHARLVQIIAPHVAQAICTSRRSESSAQPKAAVSKPPAPAAPELRLVSTR